MTRPRLLALVAGAAAAAWFPSPAVAMPVDRGPTPEVHVVRAGDTLWAIAQMHGLSPDALASANGLADPRRLGIGTRVILPSSGPRGIRSAAQGSPALRSPRTPTPVGKPQRLRRPGMDWPSRGIVTSRFGYRGRKHHHGIDIAAPVGSPIRATRDGIVRSAGWQGGYGRLVILDHGGGLSTWYGHASKILVREGQRVAKGEVIARVGTSGEVTGPNLHFEVRRNNTP
ncbi:MAG: peptidoglycan DD-metalloendopeptidase family protein, partial [Armatimonadetes bacterium]|nr:peptidoglycan DD-metalloendopeptidase family protein [Armatimonadota bacterium]